MPISKSQIPLNGTNIKNVPISCLLSYDHTKTDLTEYLASKTIEYSKDSPTLVMHLLQDTKSKQSITLENGTNIENSGCRIKALPAFHAFTGADNTEIFSRIRKSTCWNRYSKLVMMPSRL